MASKPKRNEATEGTMALSMWKGKYKAQEARDKESLM